MTHGVEGLENTYQLKTIKDAINIRHQLLDNIERAALPTTSPEERKRLLSFVVCGGGPTGVEFAAELFDTINEEMVKWVSLKPAIGRRLDSSFDAHSLLQFPKVLREEVSVTIIQSRDHILNTFDSSISAYCEKKFDRERIRVVTNARVEKINDTTVVYNVKNEQDPNNREKHELPYGFCLWSTGIGKFSASKTQGGREPVALILTSFLLAMTPFSRGLSEKLEAQKNQRALVTDGYLRLKGIPDGSVYAIGDCATIENPKLLTHIMEIFETADRYV